jgi:cyanophycin synthetase
LELFVAEYDGKKLLFEALPRPRGPHSKGYYWMDNKAKMRTEFMKAGIPVAFGGVAFTFKGAKKVLDRVKSLYSEALALGKPSGSGFVITKPHIGSRSRHTNIHLLTDQDLMRGFKIAKRLSPFVIVEQELSGMVHRASVLGGRLVAVLRREPPYVIGDGVRNVKELVEEENRNPKRQGPYFHQIPIDEQTEAELARLGLSYTTIPVSGEMVIVRNNIGRSSGGSNSDVTDLVHPDNKVLFERVASVIDDPIIGIDFIIEDISKSWKEQYPCGVIECNSVPFLDLHHFPLRGNVVDTSGALWDIVWPDAKVL